MLFNQPIRHVDRDLDRSWTSDDYFDLVIWYERTGHLHGFQLCYDKAGCERSLTWTRKKGYHHAAVDSGESDPNANRSPMLVEGPAFPFDLVVREFMKRSLKIDVGIREFILDRIVEYGRQQVD